MSSRFRIEKTGLFTTVQDAGRPGYRGLGVPIGGAADRRSMAIANALAGNDATEPALELTRLGATILALGPLYVALAGAPTEARLEFASGQSRKLPAVGAFPLQPGDRLIMGAIQNGCRAYLAVHGGIQAPSTLGSCSSETPITPNAEFEAQSATGPFLHLRSERIEFAPGEPLELRFFNGPDYEPGTHPPLDGAILTLGREWSRMGISLASDQEQNRTDYPLEPNRLSTPVAPGAIQWTGSRWLILGPAGGTMGGYPHIGQFVRTNLDRLAQCLPGQKIRLASVTIEEARSMDESMHVALTQRILIIRTLVSSEIRPVLAS